MRTLLFGVLAIGFLFSGCKKKEQMNPCEYDACAFKAPPSEIKMVEDYLVANGLTATQHCSGAYYIIDAVGSGATPDICSYINANYVGKLTNGNVFDQGTFPQLYPLSGLIRGWANLLPLIKQGGKMRLFIPPSLGYGPNPNRDIPGNSVLIFDLELTAVR